MSSWPKLTRGKKTRNIVVSIFVVLFVIVASIFVYINTINTRPKKLLRTATEDVALALFGSERQSIKGSVIVKDLNNQNVGLNSDFTGDFSGGILNPGTTRYLNFESALRQDSGESKVSGEIMSTPSGANYIKVSNLPDLIRARSQVSTLPYVADGSAKFESLAKSYQDKWVTFSSKDLEALGIMKPAANVCISPFSDADRLQKTQSVYQKHPFLEIVQLTKSKDLRLQLKINQIIFDEFVREFGVKEPDCQWVSSIKAMTNVEVWLDKLSHRPAKLALTLRENTNQTEATFEFLKPTAEMPKAPSVSVSVQQFKNELEQVIGTPISLAPSQTVAN